MNTTTLIGNLGADPEVRFLPNGQAVANFSIATNERWKNDRGEKMEHTEWHRIVAWGKTAEVAGEYLQKGSKVAIVGQLRTRDWTDKEGGKRQTTEIHVNRLEFLDAKGKDDRATPAGDEDNDSGRGR